MIASKVLKTILPHTSFMRGIKTRPFNEVLQEITTFSKSSHNVCKDIKLAGKKTTRFEQFFRQNHTPALEDMGRVDNQKWDLLEQLCSRQGLKTKDIGAIARYDNETVKFLSELPDEKLLKLRDFLRMKDSHCEYLQAVNSDTLKFLSEMKEPQLNFVKKYIQLENRGYKVFNNKEILALSELGCNEQQMNKLIFDGGLNGESILEAKMVKNLNTDKLIEEINQAKKLYGKKFGRAHIMHNSYNPDNFTLAIAEKGTGKAYLKTFDKDFKVINQEELFIESIENGNLSLTRENVKSLQKTPELLKMLEKDENTIIKLRRISQKGELNSDVTLKANYTETTQNPKLLFSKSQVLKEDLSFVNKEGEKIVETMIPSEVEGVYKIVQKAPNGTVKVLGDAKIDPQTGLKTITKNLESLDGTTTNKVITIQPNGNKSLTYVIKDSDGNVLMNRQLTHTFVSPTEAISKVNGNTYKISYSTDKISVLNSQNGKVTEINLNEILKDCTPEQKQKMMTVLKQMSGENLLHINDKVKNFKVIDNILDSFACYAGKDMGIIATGGNEFVSTHELYHLISQASNVRNAEKTINLPKYVRGKIGATYQKELDLFLKQFPEAQRNHIKYFTNQLTPTSSIEETIAEGGAILNTYNNIPLFSIRSEYLERYFPKTIAQIEKATIHTEPQVLEKIASKQLYDIGSMSKKLNIPDFMNTRNKGVHIA